MPITCTPYKTLYGPLSLTGVTCSLWMDGADTTTMTTSGTTITRMNDKSGLGYNTTVIGGAPALTTNAINGLSAIYFNGSSYMTGCNANTTTTGTFFLIATLASGQGANQIYTSAYCFSRAVSGAACYNEVQSINGLSCLAGATSLAMSPQRTNVNGPTYTLSNYNTAFMHTTVCNGTTMAGYGNGNSLGTTSSSGNFAYTFYNIGSQTSQAVIFYNYNWTGYVGELIAFNNALSDPQRQQVEGYLAQKWGLTAYLPAGHLGLTQTLYINKFYAPAPSLALQSTYYLNFNPVTIPNCLIWFDAADSTKLSLTGTTVNSWTSKASFTGSATSPSGTVISGTITQNSLNVIRFSSQSSLSFTLAEPNQARAWFSVVRLTTPQINNGGQVASIISQTTNGIGQESITAPCYPISGGFAMAITQTGVADIVKTPFSLPDYTNIWCVYSWVNSATSTSSNALTINGTLQTLATSSLASNYITSSYTKTIGSSLASAYVGFDVGEILMYNGEITTPQRQLVESYLAQKWGLQDSLPRNHLNFTNPAGLPAVDPSLTKTVGNIPYIIATGGTVTFAFGREFHTFTSNGTFTITTNTRSRQIDILCVGGGGGGGCFEGGGGGGGGFTLLTTNLAFGSYTITLGNGGTGGVGSGAAGGTGGTTTFGALVTAAGGGGGGSSFGSGPSNGASGGGGAYNQSYGTGSPGGNGAVADASLLWGGGGGGASGSATNNNGGPGTAYYGAYYGGGGGGGGNQGSPGTGGIGGGGAGGGSGTPSVQSPLPAPTPGTPNTGGGGGGMGYNSNTGAIGGSGVVIVSFSTS